VVRLKRKIAVITGSRAEYGLLYWTMKEIEESENLELQLIVTGSHLSPLYGNTYKKIEEDGFSVTRKVDMHISSNTPQSISKSMGLGMIGFAQVFDELKPDIILVLGDRYEILAAVCAALPFNIPVAHFAGGEITEGAIDEQIRHAITKMSHIHFPGADVYIDNVKRMGEESWRVFDVGDPAIENIRRTVFIEKKILLRANDSCCHPPIIIAGNRQIINNQSSIMLGRMRSWP
jgi:GDP/UDP-N,N'-diacetylbacillosamine 2-epimerase (hydrolysing)